MEKKDLLESIENLTIWKKGDKKAPHKPLLQIIEILL